MNVEQFAVNRKLALEAIDRCLGALVRFVARHFCGRLGPLKVALGTALLSLLVSFPVYKDLGKQLDDDPVITALLIKFHHPLAAIPSQLKDSVVYDGAGSHNDKIELRLTLPVLGWLTHTGKWTVVVWSPVCALIVFYLLARLAGRALDDDVGGALFVLALAPAFFGAWFFNDIDYGDAVAILFLLLAIASTNPVLTSAAFVAAAFADERCVTAAPLLLLYFAVSLGGDAEKMRRRMQYVAILLGLVVWALLRGSIAHTHHLTTGTSAVAELWISRENLLKKIPYESFNAFKTAWLLPFAALICLWVQRKWLHWFAFAGALAIACVPALLVADVSRSLCYAFPVLLVSLYFFRGDKEPARKYLAALLVANLLFLSPGATIFRVVAWLR